MMSGDSAQPARSADIARVAEQSFAYGAAMPATQLLSSSRHAGWTSLLVERSRSAGVCPEYDTLATPDQTLVVVTKGEVDLACRANGIWRRALYGNGSLGRIRAGQSDRLVWRLSRSVESFEKTHLFIPQSFFDEAADHLRRPGGPSSADPDFALAAPDALIAQTAAALVAAADAGAPDLYAETAARMIAIHLLMRHSRFGTPEDDRGAGDLSDRRIARVVDYMSAHLDRPLSLDRLAAEAGISKFHFARLFRERTGASPARLLTRLRMAAARRLLLGADASIAQIATMCGYPNAAHFSTAYRRQFGVSPRDARGGPTAPIG